MPTTNTLLPPLQATVDTLTKEFERIPAARKETIEELTRFIQHKLDAGEPVHLNFICTHNSRRSHLAQIWAQTAAHYYGVPRVSTYSGGTEATAFNPRAVRAMEEAGFLIVKANENENPVYSVTYAEGVPAIKAFSKRYDDPFNRATDFAAIMTCSHADENCPVVIGATARIALRYDDPKEFDNSPLEASKYEERVRQIGREILFAFAQVKV